MGEHSTWWDLIPGMSDLEHAVTSAVGPTWLGHQPISLAHVLSALLVCALVLCFALVLRKKTQDIDKAIVPDPTFNVRNFLEMFVEAAYGIMKDIMGEKAAKYFLPLIGTAALYIFFSNILGLIPGFAPPTSNFNTTVSCALVIFFTTHIYGVREHGLKYFKHFLGPVTSAPKTWWSPPVWLGVIALMLLMLVVEIIGHLARPLSLSIRLAANLSADHIVVGGFYKLLNIVAPVPIMLLGVLVCVVQTLVFCILSTVYISMAIAHEEH